MRAPVPPRYRRFASNSPHGVPGFPLSDLGQQQSVEVANLLFEELGGPNGVAGIFGGQEQRMIETADPFDKLDVAAGETFSGAFGSVIIGTA